VSTSRNCTTITFRPHCTGIFAIAKQYLPAPRVYTGMEASRPPDADGNMPDGDAMADTIRRERPWLRRHVPDLQDVEDILQDAFYEFVLASRLIEPVRNAGAWLLTIVCNRVTDRYRRRDHTAAPLAGIIGAADDDDASGALADVIPDTGADPERVFLRMRLVLALEDGLRALPADQRAVSLPTRSTACRSRPWRRPVATASIPCCRASTPR
jgi:DNA-directed RNA polymerase specialized sigma24 family protein